MSEKLFQFTNETDDDEYLILNRDYIHVHSCGVSNSLKGHTFSRDNGTPDYMLNFIAEGSFVYNNDSSGISNNYKAEKGAVIIYKPNEPQMFSGLNHKATRYWIHFLGYGVEELLSNCNLDKKRFYEVSNIKPIEQIFLKIINEMQSANEYKFIKCNSYLLDLLSEIARLVHNNSAANGQIVKQLFPAINTINTCYQKNIDIEDLASRCLMSKYHFIRSFKALTGLTPYAYLTNVRISAAKDLLKSTNIKIGSIADSVGIPDQLYFSKLFKKHTGLTPSEYRKKK